MTNTQRGNTEEMFTGWGGHGALNQSEMLKKLIIKENPSDMIRGTKISYKDEKDIHRYGTALLSEMPIVYPIPNRTMCSTGHTFKHDGSSCSVAFDIFECIIHGRKQYF